MDRERKLRHISEAEAHIAQGRRHIERQRVLIAELEAHGHDTTQARDLLETFEITQQTHEEHLQTLRRDLREHDAGSSR